MAMGALVVVCDFVGIAGFGFGLLTAITIIFQVNSSFSLGPCFCLIPFFVISTMKRFRASTGETSLS